MSCNVNYRGIWSHFCEVVLSGNYPSQEEAHLSSLIYRIAMLASKVHMIVKIMPSLKIHRVSAFTRVKCLNVHCHLALRRGKG